MLPCTGRTEGVCVVLLLALLLVLIFFGAGFALHILWIVAVVLLVFWLVGFALGRGEGAGKNKFYRWSPPPRPCARLRWYVKRCAESEPGTLGQVASRFRGDL